MAPVMEAEAERLVRCPDVGGRGDVDEVGRRLKKFVTKTDRNPDAGLGRNKREREKERERDVEWEKHS